MILLNCGWAISFLCLFYLHKKVKPEEKTEGNKKPETDTSPVLIISGFALYEDSQLLQNLKELTKDLNCLVRGLSWDDLLYELEVEEDEEKA